MAKQLHQESVEQGFFGWAPESQTSSNLLNGFLWVSKNLSVIIIRFCFVILIQLISM
jgi:hypothetical protein